MKIGFTYNAAGAYQLQPGDSPDRYAEFDKQETLDEIAGALASGGHEVVHIGDGRELLRRMVVLGERWDLIFNIAEGLWGRNRESQVPAICELLDQPYSGSDALTLGLTLDKVLAKRVVLQHGLSTPDFFVVEKPSDLRHANPQFPLIAKLNQEGTSKGLGQDNVVHDKKALAKKVQALLDTYRQPVLVERFIAGTEFTVAVIGNGRPEPLPIVQVGIKERLDLGEEIYTHARVESDEIQYHCPAKIPAKLAQVIRRLAVDCYCALGCRDLGRIDIRVDRRGTPYFLECNPLPNLGHIDVFPLVAKAVGLTYNQLLSTILRLALKRYDLAE